MNLLAISFSSDALCNFKLNGMRCVIILILLVSSYGNYVSITLTLKIGAATYLVFYSIITHNILTQAIVLGSRLVFLGRQLLV